MKEVFLLAGSVLSISSCAVTTPIKNLPLPPVTIIEGSISKLDANGFTLKDDSGSIFVNALYPAKKKLGVHLDEKVKVYGNLRSGQDRVFDGYVIEKTSGEQIIVSLPTPHIGCFVQSSFE